MGLVRAISVILAAASLAAPGLANSGHADFEARLLAQHNRARAEAALGGLRWNARLAEEADGWARDLAGRGVLEHAGSRDGRRAGENLWMGTSGAFTLEEMMDGFIDEKRHFRPGRFPEVSHTGDWSDVGHYTQIIWPATREVGCALARGRDDDVLVCRYWPAGNWVGHEVGVPLRTAAVTRRGR